MLRDSLRIADADRNRMRGMLSTVNRVEAVLAVTTVSDSAHSTKDCFDGGGIGVELQLISPTSGLSFQNQDFTADISRFPSGSTKLRFHLQPSAQSLGGALNLNALGSITTAKTNLAPLLRAAGLDASLSDEAGSTKLVILVNGVPVAESDSLQPCEGRLSGGPVTYCVAPLFRDVAIQYSRGGLPPGRDIDEAASSQFTSPRQEPQTPECQKASRFTPILQPVGPQNASDSAAAHRRVTLHGLPLRQSASHYTNILARLAAGDTVYVIDEPVRVPHRLEDGLVVRSAQLRTSQGVLAVPPGSLVAIVSEGGAGPTVSAFLEQGETLGILSPVDAIERYSAADEMWIRVLASSHLIGFVPVRFLVR